MSNSLRVRTADSEPEAGITTEDMPSAAASAAAIAGLQALEREFAEFLRAAEKNEPSRADFAAKVRD